MSCEVSYTHQQKVMVVFTLLLNLLINVSLIAFICSEYEHTDLILKCLFFMVMVSITFGLLLYFIFEVYTCCFSHKIDDLLVLVQSIMVWISVFTTSRLLLKVYQVFVPSENGNILVYTSDVS